MHAADAEIGGMEPRARRALVELHQLFALFEAPEHRRHRADIHSEGRDVEQVIEDAPDLAIEHADRLAALRRRDAQQALGGEHEGVLLVHRRDVIEPVEIRNGLEVGFVFDELLGAAMQQSDMRIGALDDLAVHFQHHAQHAVRGRVLRPEIEIEIFDPRLGHQALASGLAGGVPVAFSSPGSGRIMPSQGERKSKLRNSWVSLTGS